jgi:hypothetical protein
MLLGCVHAHLPAGAPHRRGRRRSSLGGILGYMVSVVLDNVTRARPLLVTQ